MKLCDAIIHTLIDLKVEHVFGVSGANIEHLHDSIHRAGPEKIRSVMAKHETSAAFMADCYARVHNRLGVCCATSGGGMMNLLAGVAESYAESVPMLAIVGQPPSNLDGKGAFQDSSGIGNTVNSEPLWLAASKFSARIDSPGEFWEIFRRALIAAMSGRPGPGVLLIPRNIFDEEVGARPPMWLQSLQSEQANEVNVESALQLMSEIRNSRSPVMVIGAGIRRCSAPESIVAFAKKTGMPIVTTMSARGDFPNLDPNYLGMLGVAGHPSVHKYITEQADTILAVGTSLKIMTRMPINDALQHKKLLLVHDDVESVGRYCEPTVAIQADIGKIFGHLLKELEREPVRFEVKENYQRTCFAPKVIEHKSNKSGSHFGLGRNSAPTGNLLQSDALQIINNHLPQNGHIVFDAGNCAAAAMHYTHVPSGTSSNIALGMGAMGYAIGGAIGAQIGSDQNARTIAFVGDGAFLMCGLEVHTAVEHALPILYVIFNNNMHGMCVTRQKLFFDGRIECSTYSQIDVSQIARGLGCEERLWVGRASNATQLQQELDAYFLQSPKPGVLELCLHHEQWPPFAPFLSQDAQVIGLDEFLKYNRGGGLI